MRNGDRRNFAVTGAGGYIAPRHLQAIRDTGHAVVAAVDPKDCAGILDRYGSGIRVFTELGPFARHLEHLRDTGEQTRVHYVSICTPSDLHADQCRLALRAGANVICEKPLVLDPCDLDALEEEEQVTGHRVWTVLQLRLHPALIALRERLGRDHGARREVSITYVTARGTAYDESWKGSQNRSGGVVTNIGIHLFDLLLWLFGPAMVSGVHLAAPRRMAGFVELERARVRWLVSVDAADVPDAVAARGESRHHSIVIDGESVEFSSGFTDRHTSVYEHTLAGEGVGISEARASIELVHAIRSARVTPADASNAHPLSCGGAEPVWFS
jgi:UDP-N-acetyl-2-amino-2-deoxyglucuronate dehydrogenase